MHNSRNHHLVKGAIAGMIGGLIASWSMNQFQAGVSKVKEAWQNSARQPVPRHSSNASGDEPATALLARRISRAVLGRDLSEREMNVAEPLVHYAYGTLAGGLYGIMAELTTIARTGAGTGYGTALWVGGDEIAVPKLQLSKPAAAYAPRVHAQALASHLVYGLSAEAVRRGVRALL